MDLFGGLPGLRFLVPDHVLAEIAWQDQADQVETALNARHLTQTSIADATEMLTYADLRRTLGQGEAACLAIAEHRGFLVASDETRAFRREAVARIGEERLLTTPDLIIRAIRAGLTTVEEADTWKLKLAKKRFQMKFTSFRGIL